MMKFRRPRGLRLPILMYHSISHDRETGHPYYWINTSPALFAQHMQYLADHNYQVISLSHAVEMIRGFSPTTKHQPLNTKAVVLTFDDGFEDFYTHAFPVLRRHGFTATVFLPTDYIGNGRPTLRGKAHLTWDRVRELSAAGITFGSHTCSHPQLHDLGPEEITRELSTSKQTIESQLNVSAGQPRGVDSFCYPYKFPEHDIQFVSTLSKVLRSVGYDCCLSTRIGTTHSADDLFALRRVPINSADDQALFAAKLSGAYDCMATLQALSKKARSAGKTRTR